MSWTTLRLWPEVKEFPKLFRIKYAPWPIFVRDDVAQAIEALGLDGPYLQELDGVSA
jgi:hypothetical protein